jgi:cytochrome b involved in lipid metabolism
MTSQIKALIVVGIIVLVGIGVFVLSSENNSAENTATNESNNTSTNPSNNESEQAPTAITLDEVSQHNKENDCWTVINGDVYDITDYIPRHPGGNDILATCGEDGTTLFTTRTDIKGEKIGSGTPHSSSASSQLQKYFIGSLQ